jgi:hypothetical protein
MLAETAYTFNEDGTVNMKTPMFDKDMPGTYTLEEAKLTITGNETKKAEVLTVDTLTADQLVLSMEQGGKKAVMTFSR